MWSGSSQVLFPSLVMNLYVVERQNLVANAFDKLAGIDSAVTNTPFEIDTSNSF